MGAVAVEDDDRHTESEVLKVLADSEEVRWKVVVHEEMKYVLLYLTGGIGGIIHQPRTIAYFSVEDLTGRKCLVTLDQLQDIIRQLVISAPGHILIALVNFEGQDVHLFFEHFRRVDRKGSAGFQVWDHFYGIKANFCRKF